MRRVPAVLMCAAFWCVSLVAVCSAGAEPAVIAHRGASGYLPEHTLAAYAVAHAMGADFIEPDVVLTRDGVPICLHDLTLETTTDVAEVFPDRARDDGKFYAIDFDAAEITRLQKIGREGRPRQFGHRVPTLAEMIGLVQDLNARTGRSVGIVPEAKAPAFHAEHGVSLPSVLLKTLAENGYHGPGDGCIVQCFDLGALRQMHDELGTELPLVFLVGEPVDDTTLADAASFCAGIGAKWTSLAGTDDSGLPTAPTPFAASIRSLGLLVYPWTFGTDEAPLRFFASEFPVDGVFADYPDVAIRVRDELMPREPSAPKPTTSGSRSGLHGTGSSGP